MLRRWRTLLAMMRMMLFDSIPVSEGFWEKHDEAAKQPLKMTSRDAILFMTLEM